MSGLLLDVIRAAIKARAYRFTLHAADRMTKRRIALGEVEEALLDRGAEVIEDHPNDPRGASCLIYAVTLGGKLIHVQCTYPPNLAVITAYVPDIEGWADWRRRKKGEK